ncbi:UNVERIFIED_CONTAM: hypothetical protein NCL1_29383 [Trichonephila clavipes]
MTCCVEGLMNINTVKAQSPVIDKSRDMTYPITYTNPGADGMTPECLNTYPGVELLPTVGDAYFQYSNTVQQRLLPTEPVRDY